MKIVFNICFLFWFIVAMSFFQYSALKMIILVICLEPLFYCLSDVIGSYYNKLIKNFIGGF